LVSGDRILLCSPYAGMELDTFLLPVCWGHRQVPLCPASRSFFCLSELDFNLERVPPLL
jgi:hypothetical protein